MSSTKSLSIENLVMKKIETLKRLFEKLKKMSMVNLGLIVISIASFVLFYLSVEDGVFEALDVLLNLDWYWYLIVGIILIIKPAVYLMKR